MMENEERMPYERTAYDQRSRLLVDEVTPAKGGRQESVRRGDVRLHSARVSAYQFRNAH